MDTEKRIQNLRDRLNYARDIFNGKHAENVNLLSARLEELEQSQQAGTLSDPHAALVALEDLFGFVERKLEAELTPMDRVRIVRHPQRICLRDILENVYDNFTEIGGKDEYSIDPSIVIARAYITRRKGKTVINQPVMVIGHEKGHGEEYRNGGSAKPWGNARALSYMRVAETENIPIHTYVFTPGAYPVEEYPGAGQQIARNLYALSGLRVPVVAVFSEGGSGGAEAIALADRRLMLSHGYYSVISPEGAAAIEGRIKGDERASADLIERCASMMAITAFDNQRNGYIDHVVQEPPLGARAYHYDFFRQLRREVIRATDEAVLNARVFSPFRGAAVRRMNKKDESQLTEYDDLYARWVLSSGARERLVFQRHKKFRKLSEHARKDKRPFYRKFTGTVSQAGWDLYSYIKYDLLNKNKKKITNLVEEVEAEANFVARRITAPFRNVARLFKRKRPLDAEAQRALTALSDWNEANSRASWHYISPRAKEDRAITCPNTATAGCLDLWAPDLFGEFAGVCANCGHHFPMEHQWYVHNVFDQGSVFEFNSEIEAGNPLNFEGFDVRIEQAKKKTGQKSSCTTFEARIDNTKLVVAMLTANFRGGSVGAAEGEKFILAAERAQRKRWPFLAYVHGTAGIRIQEGVNGVIQMPRCTMAVQRYIEAGGLYIVLYDTNSYAGPLASFLGCSPYQFAIRSTNIGFAGRGVIKETTGVDIPPDYHNVYRALSRGHIQGIWDRRDARNNLKQALMSMGGRNLYYR